MRTSRKRIGLLVPSSNTAAEPELARHLPEDATVHTARMFSRSATGLSGMLDHYLPDAVRDLASMKPDVVVFACTSAGAARGAAFEANLIRDISEKTGAPTISVMAESAAALRTIGARRVGVLTPYEEESNRQIERALTAGGFEVAAIEGLRIPGVASPDLTADDFIEFGNRVLAGKEIDAVFISCTDLFTIDSIPEYEAAFGKPVVTSMSAVVGAVERELGAVPV